MSHQETVRQLIALAQEALAVIDQGAVDTLLEKTGIYLDQFEAWQKTVSQDNPLSESSSVSEEEKAELRELLANLNEVHQQLLQHAGSTKDQVGAAMGEMHRKTSGMKKYIDKLPPRISITGKRKG